MVGARFFRLEMAAGDESKFNLIRKLSKIKARHFWGQGKKLNNVQNKILEIV